MSTRACYTFADANGKRTVYKHHDGYPSGAADALEAALGFAWKLPRFEADEFAAAFIAGNKPRGGGGVYLTGKPADHADTEWEYRITCVPVNTFALGRLDVDAYHGYGPRKRLVGRGLTLAELQALKLLGE